MELFDQPRNWKFFDHAKTMNRCESRFEQRKSRLTFYSLATRWVNYCVLRSKIIHKLDNYAGKATSTPISLNFIYIVESSMCFVRGTKVVQKLD